MKKLILALVFMLSGMALAEEPRVPDEPMPPAAAADARKACTDAMNQDPAFAKSIIDTVDKQAEARTLQAHAEAAKHIQKNEKHVIYAYAAMWVIAALFVGFLWMRQQALKAEIAQLRRDLDDAAKDDKK
jgi:hypothetical protein